MDKYLANLTQHSVVHQFKISEGIRISTYLRTPYLRYLASPALASQALAQPGTLLSLPRSNLTLAPFQIVARLLVLRIDQN